MTIRIAPILGLFSVAGLSIIVTGCEPLENVLTVMNSGTPVPGGPSPSVAVYVSPTPSVERVEVAMESQTVPPCVIVGNEFRMWMCDEVTGRKILIP